MKWIDNRQFAFIVASAIQYEKYIILSFLPPLPPLSTAQKNKNKSIMKCLKICDITSLPQMVQLAVYFRALYQLLNEDSKTSLILAGDSVAMTTYRVHKKSCQPFLATSSS